MEEQNDMSFLEHLEELRWRIVRSVIAIIIVAIGIFLGLEWIMDNIFLSMNSDQFISYRVMCDLVNLCVEVTPVKAQGLKMTSQFSYALLISFLGGFIVAFPFVFHQLWGFVKPGLKQNEKKTFKGIVFYVSLLFFLGVLFGYFVVAPMCVQFFGEFRISPSIETNPGIDSYVSLITSTVFYTGLLFLLPIVIYLLAKIGIVNSEFLKKYRKHSIVGVLILSAIITPPDFISQIIVSIPIIFLYEIGVILAKRVEKDQLIEK